jgi:hypothetical protein
MMFRLEIFVDDKKLAYVLWALTGHILGDPKIQPVVNAAKKKNGELAAMSSGKQMDMFAEYLKTLKAGTLVTSPMVREFCSKHGWADDSCYSIVTRARSRKWLTRAAGAGKTGLSASRYRITMKEPSHG